MTDAPQAAMTASGQARSEMTWPSGLFAQVLLALGFIALAFLVRWPSLLYSVIDWDESLYILIADALAERGALPYTEIWDRKPVGIFLIFAGVIKAGFDPILGVRLLASVVVGLNAWLLFDLGQRLLRDARSGLIAGLAYVLMTTTSGGLAANTELFFAFFALHGLVLALRAIAPWQDQPYAGQPVLLALAGLMLGCGLIVKYSLIFDAAAFVLGWFILTTPSLGRLPQHLLRSLPSLLVMAIGLVIPTLLAMAWYLSAGALDAYLFANFHAYTEFFGESKPLINPALILTGIANHFPLWLGAAAAVLAAPWLIRDQHDGRALAFLLVWLACTVLSVIFLRHYYWHYFLQILPPLALLTGFALSRGLLARLSGFWPQTALVIALAALALIGVARETYLHGLLLTKERLTDGDPLAGDIPRQIARDLATELAVGDSVYVYDQHPIIYHLLDVPPPTRLPFFLHIKEEGAYGLTDPHAEIERIIAARPAFIISKAGVLEGDAARSHPINAVVAEAVAQDYTIWRSYPDHRLRHIHRFARLDVGNTDAIVYRLQDAGGG